MKFKQEHVQCISRSGLHRMAYTEWGDRHNPRVLICVHGLTRNGRDFDALAEAMSAIPGDLPGCGRPRQERSLRDPAGYEIPQYVADMVTLIARLDVERVDWIGSSMGGLIGMALASQEGTPVGKLLLNDVGPVITVEALQRIATYVGADPVWPTFEDVLAYVKLISAPFGNLTEGQWWHLTENSVAQRADRRWGFLSDPELAPPFKATFVDQDIDLCRSTNRSAARRWFCAAPNPTS